MDQKFTDNPSSLKVIELMEEIEFLQQQIQSLQKEIKTIQHHCRHIFWETSYMRKCQKCGYTESTYY
jgi:hypothetical protein